MVAWQVYAIVEYAASTVVPLLLYENMVIADWHWKLSLLLFGLFTLGGMAAGGIGCVVFAVLKRTPVENPQRDCKAVGTLTLVLAFVANLARGEREPSTIMVAVALAGMLMWSLSSEMRERRFSLLANPWATSLFLLIAARIGYGVLHGRPLFIRSAAGLALLAAFAGVSIVSTRLWGKRRGGRWWQEAAVVAGGALAVLGCAVSLNPDIHAQAGSGSRQDVSRPNVILVTMDTVRADHLSLYGYSRNTTPNLAQLAQSSTVFAHAIAAGDMTLTSHAAILTGTYGSWNGAHPDLGNGPHSISDQYATLPEILTKQGYSTAAILANTAYLQPTFGFSRGFQLFEIRVPLRFLSEKNPYYLRNGARRAISRFGCTAEFDLPIRRADEINREAFRFLRASRVSPQKPFFLFVNYMDAHAPYVPPAPFDAMFPGKDCSVTNI